MSINKELIQLNCYFCPKCHLSTLKDSYVYIEYKKCQTCGFMELKIDSIERVKLALSKIS